jgi:molecular chaperone GrpE
LVHAALREIVCVVSEPEKGKFAADISQRVIEEALHSVEKVPPSDEQAPPAPEAAAPEGAAPPAPEAPAPSPDASLAKTQGEIEELRNQLTLSQEKGRETMTRLQEVHERMLRSVADLENYRKRAQKEKEQMQKFGAEKILSDFLPVLDNLDRALDHSNSAADFSSLMQGVSMTRKLFEDALTKHGVQPIPAVGHPFDPHVHEAIQQVEREDLPPNQVISELVSGYTLNDRLLRPALVVVARAPTAPPKASAPAEQKPADAPEAPVGGADEHKP